MTLPEPPSLPIEPARSSLMERMSIVWLVPLLALVIALGVAWQSYLEKGPLITIAFEEASGINAGETKLRYRNVVVGEVEEIGFSPSLERVLVAVRVDKEVAPFVDAQASFWVVHPEVTAQGVTGLDTVLSGVYIEGVWDTDPDGLATEFAGTQQAPLIKVGESGLRLILRASGDTTLTSSGPIIYKGVEVGRLGTAQLSGDGASAEAEAVVYAPYDRLITSATRFWDASGFSFSLGPNGAELDFSSLASLISGGVTFETIISGGTPVTDGESFIVHPGEATARASVFSEGDGQLASLTAVFDENLSGLSLGAPVEVGGVRVGEVTNLTGIVDSDAFGDDRIRLRATLELRPTRLGLEPGDDAMAFFEDRVASGLRARLATASILTGGLKVELVETPEATAEGLDLAAVPFPRIPSIESDVSESALSAESVLARVNALPVEDLMASAIGFLNNASALVADQELRRVPGEVAGLLGDMRGVVGSDEFQALPAQVGAIAAELEGAARQISVILAALEEEDAVARLLRAVDAAAAVAQQVAEFAEDMPALVAEIEALTAKANALPLQELVVEATGLVTSAEALIGSDATKAIPVQLAASLAQVEAMVTSFNAADGTARLLAAVDAAGGAATSLKGSFDGLPELMGQLEALATTANSLPLDDLVAETNALLAAAKTLMADEGARALPAALTAALTQLEVTLAATNAAEGPARLIAAVDAAGAAAGKVGEALDTLPDLMAELQALSTTARGLPLSDLLTQTGETLTAVEQFLEQEGTLALPAALTTALADIEALTETLTTQDGVPRLLAAVDAAGAAAGSIDAATTGVPDLVAQLSTVAGSAAELPLTELVAELTALLGTADAILDTDGARTLPDALSDALAEVAVVLQELREGGTLENVNATLSAAETAASSIATATTDLPALIARLDRVLGQTAATLAAYDSRSDVNKDVRAALREISQAAAAVQSLARAIERRPNSILTGR